MFGPNQPTIWSNYDFLILVNVFSPPDGVIPTDRVVYDGIQILMIYPCKTKFTSDYNNRQ